MQDDDVRPELLNLEKDVRHRGGFPNDDEPPLLEKEARESTLKRPAIGDDRGASRRPSSHDRFPTLGAVSLVYRIRGPHSTPWGW